ncbi:MAG: histidine kinase dimerization/phospho-acceptor domain-containing protein [Vicinamibacterales bacterium]
MVERLVSGVAHDFNNLLTVLAGNTDLLLEGGSLEPDTRELVEEIRTVAVRAVGLTQRLVTIAARQGGDVTRFDLRQVLHAIQPLLRRAYPANITLDFQRFSTPLPVDGDPGLLELGLMTLAIGLRDFTRAGDTVTFHLSHLLVPSAGMPECPELDPGPHAVLDISDSAAALAGGAGDLEVELLESAVKLSRGCLRARGRDDGATMSLYLPLANAG